MEDETNSGKGRPTPSRKEAQAIRRQQMKTPMTRKEQLKRDRAARQQIRERQREALRTGKESDLPRRDRGPARRLARDVVDRRLSFAEFLLPLLIGVLILSLVGNPAVTAFSTYVWMIAILATVIEEVRLVRTLRKEVRNRLPDASTKGLTAYAVLRSTQMRISRQPKPQIKRGAPLATHY